MTFSFLSNILQDERKEDKQQVLIPGRQQELQQYGSFLAAWHSLQSQIHKKKLSFPVHYLFGFSNTASEKHKHKQKLKRCDITGSFMDTVYYIVCIIIFISSERAPTYRCFTWYSRRSFLKQNLVLNIPTTDFEGVKTRPVLHFCEICCFL